MHEQWYCRIENRDYGPMTQNDVASLASQGRLKPTDFVRDGAGSNWVPASRVYGLRFPVSHGGVSQTFTGASTALPASDSSLLGHRPMSNASSKSLMPWVIGCGAAVGLAGLFLFAILLTAVVSGGGGTSHARIRVTWKDGTPELQAMASRLSPEQLALLGVGALFTGMDIYGARVRIENTGGVPVHVSPDNVVIHLGAQSTGVTSANDARFLRRTTLQPGQFTEGLVMFRAAPDSGAAVRLGAGSLSYQDASIEVVY